MRNKVTKTERKRQIENLLFTEWVANNFDPYAMEMIQRTIKNMVAVTFNEDKSCGEWTAHARAAFQFELVAMHRFTRPTMENEIIRSLLRAALTSDLMSANELGESSSELDKIVTLVGKAKHEDAEVWKAQAHWAFFQHRQEKRAAERDQWKVRNAQMTSRITARELEAMCDPCAFDPDELFAARAAE